MVKYFWIKKYTENFSPFFYIDEMIQIEKKYGQFFVFSISNWDGFVKAVHKQDPVWQAGQGIEVGYAMDSLLWFLVFCYVLEQCGNQALVRRKDVDIVELLSAG